MVRITPTSNILLSGGGGGGVIMYVNENIPSRRLNGHTIPDDVEIMCVEINLKNKSGYY